MPELCDDDRILGPAIGERDGDGGEDPPPPPPPSAKKKESESERLRWREEGGKSRVGSHNRLLLSLHLLSFFIFPETL